MIGLTTSSWTSAKICSLETSSECWTLTSTVSTRRGRPSASYSTVTWVFPSGRAQRRVPSRLAVESWRASRWASWMGAGISSGVSSQAKPTIIPWSPAPPVLTPWAMSGDCSSMDTRTPQVSKSKPNLARV